MTSMGNAFRSRPRWRQRPRSRAFTSGAASSAMYSSTPPASHTGNVSRHGVPLATDTATHGHPTLAAFRQAANRSHAAMDPEGLNEPAACGVELVEIGRAHHGQCFPLAGAHASTT